MEGRLGPFTKKIIRKMRNLKDFLNSRSFEYIYSDELKKIENLLHEGRATYIGNNRILTKIFTGGHNFAYIVEADDLLISPWFIITGEYETNLTKYFLSNLNESSHCLDIGSNFGFFGVLFSRIASKGKVLCVEADENVYKICRDNLMINGLQNTSTAIHAAVNADGADTTLHRRVTRSGNTSIIAADRALTDWHGEIPAQAFSVSGIRIEEFLPQMNGRVDFIKIDIEGTEPLAFRGAKKTIQQNPQIKIIMEWSPGQIRSAGTDPSDFLEELSQLGLKFYCVGGGHNFISKNELLNIEYEAGIILAINI